MKDIRSLWPLLVMLLVLAASLVTLAVIVPIDPGGWVTPSPEGTAAQLVSALSARRYSGAMEQLSQRMKSEVTNVDLQNLVHKIEESHQGIEGVQEKGSTSSTTQATTWVDVKLGDDEKRTLTIPMVRENEIWKVDSLKALEALAD